MRSLILLCGLVLFAHDALYAQRPPIRGGGGAPTGAPPASRPDATGGADGAAEQASVDEFLDTFGVFVLYAERPRQETPFGDSLLGNGFEQYDPVRQRRFDYRHLGILGSAAQPMYFETTQRRGFDVGLRQFDIYFNNANTLPYYRLEKPYTDLSYALGSEQADGYIKAAFSRNFANGVNFAVDYRRISQLGRQDQYPNQNARNTSLGMGLWYKSDNGRYESFTSFISNTAEQEDNGGVLSPPAEGGFGRAPSSAGVAMTDAQTRHGHRELAYTHYFRFAGSADTLGRQRRAFTLAHQASYKWSDYKFFNPRTTADTTFYRWHPALLPDDRGTRFLLRHQALRNAVKLATYKLADGKAANAAQQQRDLLEVGIEHAWHGLYLEPLDTSIQTLFLTGAWQIGIGEVMRLETHAHLGLVGTVGDYRLGGRLTIDLRKAGRLEVTAVNQLYSPTLVQSRMFLTQREVWGRNFRQTLETSLQAHYHLPVLGLTLGGGYHLLNNYIYFDSTALPVQTAAPLSILQIWGEKGIRVWRLHLDNLVGLQAATSDVIRLPRLLAKHSFYYEGRWFGSLDVRLGVDVRYNDTYLAPYYNPVTGQFQLQDRQQVVFYPNLDVFASIRVTKFRAFLKFENVTALLRDGELFYQTAYYPFPDAALRFGLRWRLVN